MKLPKIYEPQQYESDIYALWEKSGAFIPTDKGEPYSIVMPPPNANANLHIGYELTAAIEDIAARYHRLKGRSVLLLPGADHAGFETQAVFEKHLAKEGKSRFDFSREELYRQIWDFVANNRDSFLAQMRGMGIGCDWSRFTFTLDDKIVTRAYATFKKMWDENLIYRGERLVNYCTFHGTAFADIEVTHKEEKGSLWYLRYPLVVGEGDIIVATTRPETMFGDVAIAVNPSDERYQSFIGKTVKLPLTNREIPVIADAFVDAAFGTGAVKITPAHDQNDFDAGERHSLPKITVIDNEGRLNHEVPDAYRGLTVKDARQKVVFDLKEQGYLAKKEAHTHNVGHCYKCDTVIEPLLRDQWFVDMQPLAKPAIAALEADKVAFYPSAKKEQLTTYLKNLRDWNISRQIAWGIPIPAFQNLDDPDDWIYDERVEQEEIEVNGKKYRRDPDVFDTWFSSSSWPYATLGYPDGEDYKKYYPLSVMETGGEILYPWVSRMLMLGLYVTGEVPFESVYIHGYVMAADGSKMSKSIGNVVDPMPVIKRYGSDALRIGIITGRAPAVNRGYDPRRVEDARNFCNKLWNVARYIDDVIDETVDPTKLKPKTTADHWILCKLQQAAEAIGQHLDTYRFAEAYDTLYHFVWDDFADWYIEASKAAQNREVLAYTLEAILRLAHPFAPFVTETIWQTLAWQPDSLVATSDWPVVTAGDSTASNDFEAVRTIVGEIRYMSRIFNANKLTLYYKASEDEKGKFFERNNELITKLARLDAVVAAPTDITGVHLTQTKHTSWLDIDIAKRKKYLMELQAKREAQEKSITGLQNRLANKQYVDNAPREVVAQTETQLEESKALLENIVAEHERFEK
jgi:valyl-tRNA synthetase